MKKLLYAGLLVSIAFNIIIGFYIHKTNENYFHLGFAYNTLDGDYNRIIIEADELKNKYDNLLKLKEINK